jgi:signal transduction histidine kinase
MVEETCKLMQPLSASKSIRLDFECRTDHRELVADSAQLKQVLTNLLSNAIQASPADSRVSLELRDYIGPIPLGRAQKSDYVVLSIVDAGEGIPQQALDRIFEPFFTTKDVGQGTGLGLSIAYGIIQEHGGWIEVRNLPGTGAEFCVYLPLPSSAEEAPHNSQDSPSDPASP